MVLVEFFDDITDQKNGCFSHFLMNVFKRTLLLTRISTFYNNL